MLLLHDAKIHTHAPTYAHSWIHYLPTGTYCSPFFLANNEMKGELVLKTPHEKSVSIHLIEDETLSRSFDVYFFFLTRESS